MSKHKLLLGIRTKKRVVPLFNYYERGNYHVNRQRITRDVCSTFKSSNTSP